MRQTWLTSRSALVSRKSLADYDAAKLKKQWPATADDISSVAVAAMGTRAPLAYGRVQIPGRIGAIKIVGYQMYLLVVWCEGEIEAIQALVASGEEINYQRNDYHGSAAQDPDPWLLAAIPGYEDTLRGIQGGRSMQLAYSVIKVDGGQPFPTSPKAIIKGLKPYDPRTDTHRWTVNPALILADMLRRAGEKVDWTGSIDAFEYCDQIVDGIKRWSANLIISSPQSIVSHAETLRAYAHCMLAHTPDGIRLIPDAPIASQVFIPLTASQIVQGSLKLSRRAYRDTPTCVRVTYTDTTPPGGKENGLWGQATVEAHLPGAGGETIPWIESGLSLDGLQHSNVAHRTAQERLNAFYYRNLLGECVVRDEGLAILPGDVVSLTHPIGLTAKAMRVLDVKLEAPARYRLQLEEYDANVYSDETISYSNPPDTDLPSPLIVPVPTALDASSENYLQKDGTWGTALRISWDASGYLYRTCYQVRLFKDGKGVWSVTTPETVWDPDSLENESEVVAAPVIIGATYEYRVRLVAACGVTGNWATGSITVQAPINNPPSDVKKLTGVELGGEVRLNWTAAVDQDVWRYEIRWGASGSSWATAKLLDRVDGLRLISRDIPEGTWKFFVRAIDSIGQYSKNAATVTLDVTRDIRSFFVGDHSFTLNAGDSVGIYTITDRYGVTNTWSEVGNTVNTVFTNNANTYTSVAAAYDIGSSSKWLSDVWDLGIINDDDYYTGTVNVDLDGIAAFSGKTITTKLQTSLNGINWANYTAATFRATFAYMRISVEAAAGHGFLVTQNPYARLDVFALEESGTVTTQASGYTRITLSRSYAYAKAIILTPSGTAARTAVYDNIVIANPTTFDIYLFNASNQQIAGEVSWRFQGV